MHVTFYTVILLLFRHTSALSLKTHQAVSRRSKTPEGCSWTKMSSSLLGKSCWGTSGCAEQNLHLREREREGERNHTHSQVKCVLMNDTSSHLLSSWSCTAHFSQAIWHRKAGLPPVTWSRAGKGSYLILTYTNLIVVLLHVKWKLLREYVKKMETACPDQALMPV